MGTHVDSRERLEGNTRSYACTTPHAALRHSWFARARSRYTSTRCNARWDWKFWPWRIRLGGLCVRADDTLGTVERNGDANGAIERGRVHRVAVWISVGGERIGERAQAQGPHDAGGRKVVRDGARRVGDELLGVQRSRAKRVPVALRRARRGGDSLP